MQLDFKIFVKEKSFPKFKRMSIFLKKLRIFTLFSTKKFSPFFSCGFHSSGKGELANIINECV